MKTARPTFLGVALVLAWTVNLAAQEPSVTAQERSHPSAPTAVEGGRFLDTLGLGLSDADSVDAAAELARASASADDFVCGTVIELITEEAPFEGTMFTRTTLRLAVRTAASGQPRQNVDVLFWGSREEGSNAYTSATPDTAAGREACLFVREQDGSLWLESQNAYLEADATHRVGLGQVSAPSHRMAEAVSAYRLERQSKKEIQQ